MVLHIATNHLTASIRHFSKPGVFLGHFTYQKLFQVFVVGDNSIVNNNKF